MKTIDLESYKKKKSEEKFEEESNRLLSEIERDTIETAFISTNQDLETMLLVKDKRSKISLDNIYAEQGKVHITNVKKEKVFEVLNYCKEEGYTDLNVEKRAFTNSVEPLKGFYAIYGKNLMKEEKNEV